MRAAAEMDVERPDTRFLQQAPDNQMSRIFQVISSITSTNSQTIRCQVLAAGGTHLICNFSGKIFHCFIIISKIKEVTLGSLTIFALVHCQSLELVVN